MTYAPVPAAPGVASLASRYGMDETLERLKAAIQARGLTLFAEFDHSGEAARVGLTMQPTRVLAFGNPAAGTPLMIASPLVALELPLKTLVWQDQGGQVWVSFADPAALAQQFRLTTDQVPVLRSVERIVRSALDLGEG